MRVDAVLPRLGHGQRAADLLGERAQLLLHARERTRRRSPGGRRRGRRSGCRCRRRRRCRSRRGRRPAPPSAPRSARRRACCGSFRACLEFPAGNGWPASYALGRRGGKGRRGLTGGCGEILACTTHAQRMHGPCTRSRAVRGRLNRQGVWWRGHPHTAMEHAVTERKRTKAEERAYAELHDIAPASSRGCGSTCGSHFERLKFDNMPSDWASVEAKAPGPAGARCGSTPAYDEDVAKFFRTMGQGYQARMNAVLRAYMLGDPEPADHQQEERGLDGARYLRPSSTTEEEKEPGSATEFRTCQNERTSWPERPVRSTSHRHSS